MHNNLQNCYLITPFTFKNQYPATLNIDLLGTMSATVTAISRITVGSSHLAKHPISMLGEHLIKTNVLQIYIGGQQPSKSLLWLGKSMQRGGWQINVAGRLCHRDLIKFKYW